MFNPLTMKKGIMIIKKAKELETALKEPLLVEMRHSEGGWDVIKETAVLWTAAAR